MRRHSKQLLWLSFSDCGVLFVLSTVRRIFHWVKCMLSLMNWYQCYYKDHFVIILFIYMYLSPFLPPPPPPPFLSQVLSCPRRLRLTTTSRRRDVTQGRPFMLSTNPKTSYNSLRLVQCMCVHGWGDIATEFDGDFFSRCKLIYAWHKIALVYSLILTREAFKPWHHNVLSQV